MLCPFCLSDKGFKREKTAGSAPSGPRCKNPECRQPVPSLYVREYRRYPPVVVNAVGFRQHGKTVFFAALFYALRKLGLARRWPGFFTMSLDEESLRTVEENVDMLAHGDLPDSTPKNFPRPTLFRVEGVPGHRSSTLLCYDTGGECFERAGQLVRFAGFVKRASTAMLLVSVGDLEDPAGELHKLLNTYMIGLGELGASTERQHLLVVFTKADASSMAERLARWPDLFEYIRSDGLDAIADPRPYLRGLYDTSDTLREFALQELRADEFLHGADERFASVTFSIVSALGATPAGQKMPVQIVPRRIVDPLLWLIEKSQPRYKQAWRRWRAR